MVLHIFCNFSGSVNAFAWQIEESTGIKSINLIITFQLTVTVSCNFDYSDCAKN